MRSRISIHAPRGGSDHGRLDIVPAADIISIHAPRGGSDSTQVAAGRSRSHFNPRSPWGERPCHFCRVNGFPAFQSTLPVGGATPVFAPPRRLCRHFNPRSPWGERRLRSIVSGYISEFQSTLPVGGATPSPVWPAPGWGYFNPRSPWGERLHIDNGKYSRWTFQSTLPVGGATTDTAYPGRGQAISIHAPRGGSDSCMTMSALTWWNFNPRSPWGERRGGGISSGSIVGFQSTLPVGGATFRQSVNVRQLIISIHAPRGGSDPGRAESGPQSTISIHAPRGGSDMLLCTLAFGNSYFNPRSPWGERRLRRLTI